MIRVIKTQHPHDEWVLEVLGVPFGSPSLRDAHGEWFDNRTRLYEDKIPLPPVVYYHGYTPDGTPQEAPEFIGKTVDRWVDHLGVWYRVVLDKASSYAHRVWKAAQRGLARASSGTMEHLRRVDANGHISHWLVSELSIFDVGGDRQPANRYAVAIPVVKALYQTAGLVLPEEVINVENETSGNMETQDTVVVTKESLANAIREAHAAGVEEASVPPPVPLRGDELRNVISDALKSDNRPITVTPSELRAVMDDMKKHAVEELEEKFRKDWALGHRLPISGVPSVLKMADLRKYDHLPPEDMAMLVGVLSAPHSGSSFRGDVSPAALKALAIKIEEDKGDIGNLLRPVLRNAGIKSATKADEILATTTNGAEWVTQAYSNVLWETIRQSTVVLSMIQQQVVPQGSESMKFPLEGNDPEWYNVSQATVSDYNSTTHLVNATIPSKAVGTGSRNLSLQKLGARAIFTGEMEEDSLIPVIEQLRSQLAKSGSENLEHAIIDGDTATTNNINTTSPITNQVFTIFDGFRKVALTPTTSRSNAGSVISPGDFLETLKLLGHAGIAAADPTKVVFIVPLSLHWKLLSMSEVLTADKVANPTIENGMLSRIFGVPVYTSSQMLKMSMSRKSKEDGSISDTDTENVTTQLLCIRTDQWVLGTKRLMRIETVRQPMSDTTDIVATTRVGLVHRNAQTSASITHNIAVA